MKYGWILFCVIFCFIISVWFLVGSAVISTVSYVNDNGLKATIDRIWEGPKK